MGCYVNIREFVGVCLKLLSQCVTLNGAFISKIGLIITEISHNG